MNKINPDDLFASVERRQRCEKTSDSPITEEEIRANTFWSEITLARHEEEYLPKQASVMAGNAKRGFINAILRGGLKR